MLVRYTAVLTLVCLAALRSPAADFRQAYAFSAAGQSSCATYGPTSEMRTIFANAQNGLGSVSVPGPGCNVLESMQNSLGTAAQSASSAVSSSGVSSFSPPWTFSATSSAVAVGMGSLGVETTINFSGAGDAFTVRGSQSVAVARDSLTSYSGTGNGFYVATYAVKASVVIPSSGYAGFSFSYLKDSGPTGGLLYRVAGEQGSLSTYYQNNYVSSIPGVTITPGAVSGIADVTLSVPITYGTPFDLALYLTAVAISGNYITGTVDIDALHTASLKSIQLLDSFGNPLAFNLTGASGDTYTPTGVIPVPEPSTGIVLAAAAAALAITRFRARG